MLPMSKISVLRIDDTGLARDYDLAPYEMPNASDATTEASTFAPSEKDGYVTTLGMLLGRIRAALGAESGSLYIFDGYALRFVYVQNDALNKNEPILDESGESAFAANRDMVDKRTVYGYAFVGRKCVAIDNIRAVPNRMPFFVSPHYDDPTAYRKISTLTLPIEHNDSVVGVIQFTNKRENKKEKNNRNTFVPFDDEDIALVRIFVEEQRDLLTTLFAQCIHDVAASHGKNTAATERILDNLARASGTEPPKRRLPWLEGSGIAWTQAERGKESTISRRLMLFTDYIYCFKDSNTLIDLTLSEARDATGADAGTFYTVEDDKWLRLAHVQNDTLYPGGLSQRLYLDRRIPVSGKSICAYAVDQRRMTNVQDAWNIPPGAPYEFDRSFDNASGYRTASVLTVPIMEPDGRVFAALQLINSRDASGNIRAFDQPAEVYANYLILHVMPHLLMAIHSKRTIEKMLHMLALHNPHEGIDHATRVASAAVEIFRRWALNRKMSHSTITARSDLLYPAAMMHDVGMVCVPPDITRKTVNLSPSERAVMQKHAAAGADLFAASPAGVDCVACEIIANHHQRWDGNGYTGSPDFPILAGEQIPVFARATSVADTLEGLMSNRPYKKAWTYAGALDQIQKNAGSQLDPEMVQAAIEEEETLRTIFQRHQQEKPEHADAQAAVHISQIEGMTPIRSDRPLWTA